MVEARSGTAFWPREGVWGTSVGGIYSRPVARRKMSKWKRDDWLRGILNLIEKNQEKEYGEIEGIWSGDRHS